MRTLWIDRKVQDRKKWERVIRQESLIPEENLDEVVGVFDGEQLIATGSRQKNILKCMAVSDAYQGGSIFNQLATEIIGRITKKGYSSYYVYTKPESVNSFKFLGFKEVVRTSDVVFLEKSIKGIDDYIEELSRDKVEADRVTSIVMNANPFTKGHLYLIEKAATENDVVHLFVVSEDRSFFPTAIREELIRKGTSHIRNLHIHPTREYIVSTQTFPSYFLPENVEVIRVQAELDARLFKTRIAPALGLDSRYVGEEPYSEATAIYNQMMHETFGKDIQLIEIPRRSVSEEDPDNYISATKVRNLIISNRMDETKPFLPESTYRFLKSPRGAEVVSKAVREAN